MQLAPTPIRWMMRQCSMCDKREFTSPAMIEREAERLSRRDYSSQEEIMVLRRPTEREIEAMYPNAPCWRQPTCFWVLWFLK